MFSFYKKICFLFVCVCEYVVCMCVYEYVLCVGTRPRRSEELELQVVVDWYV